VQKYTLDRWGNRTIDAAGSSGSVNTRQFTVDAATNRLGVPSGQPESAVMQYDAAGNLTKDTWTDTVTTAINRGFDAEGRLGVVTNSANQEVGR